jgi:acyl-coenzyme A thioesterase PaaI-like protein
MGHKGSIQDKMMLALIANLGQQYEEYLIPPPIFALMRGEFISFDPEEKLLVAQFPILESYLNPYGVMQGGMIATAVDNTLGPLSVLVAPPNLTRHLDMTYSKPAAMEMGSIVVEARLLGQEGRRLVFAADVRDPTGVRLARAKAVHWIINTVS